jgi:hypothetical protein
LRFEVFHQNLTVFSSIKQDACGQRSSLALDSGTTSFQCYGGFSPAATGQSFDVDVTSVSSRQGFGAATVQPYSPNRTAVDGHFVGSHPA